jgi:hypothetical protein
MRVPAHPPTWKITEDMGKALIKVKNQSMLEHY